MKYGLLDKIKSVLIIYPYKDDSSYATKYIPILKLFYPDFSLLCNVLLLKNAEPETL
jgi:hypothetical protein